MGVVNFSRTPVTITLPEKETRSLIGYRLQAVCILQTRNGYRSWKLRSFLPFNFRLSSFPFFFFFFFFLNRHRIKWRLTSFFTKQLGALLFIEFSIASALSTPYCIFWRKFALIQSSFRSKFSGDFCLKEESPFSFCLVVNYRFVHMINVPTYKYTYDIVNAYISRKRNKE